MRPPLPPTPPASNEATRRSMRANRHADTKPEIALRRLLHADGLRFRKNFRVVAGDVRTNADVAFTRQRLAVFVDGCYWHGCPEHCRIPTRNAAYWEAKIGRNRDRDEKITTALTNAGWRVLRIWEHQPVDEAARLVSDALSER